MAKALLLSGAGLVAVAVADFFKLHHDALDGVAAAAGVTMGAVAVLYGRPRG